MEPTHECRTLADYRTRYAHYRLDPDLQRLHARHPVVATVDDHEICDDAWRGGSRKHDPHREGEWPARKAAALRAWREWMPARVGGDRPRIFRTFRIGELADLVVLDARTRRDEQTSDLELMASPERTVLGDEQHHWLAEQLERSAAAWRIVANSVMVAPVFPPPEDVARSLVDFGLLGKRCGPGPDRWDGYAADRDRLLACLRERGSENVVFLSGDVHTAWAIEVRRAAAVDRPEEAAGVEFVTPSVTSENLDEKMTYSPTSRVRRLERAVIDHNPQVRWADFDDHGYLVADINHDRVVAEWYFVADILHRCRGESLAAAWEVRAGERRLRRAGEVGAAAVAGIQGRFD
jgi:alkaline phosphatase D